MVTVAELLWYLFHQCSSSMLLQSILNFSRTKRKTKQTKIVSRKEFLTKLFRYVVTLLGLPQSYERITEA